MQCWNDHSIPFRQLFDACFVVRRRRTFLLFAIGTRSIAELRGRALTWPLPSVKAKWRFAGAAAVVCRSQHAPAALLASGQLRRATLLKFAGMGSALILSCSGGLSANAPTSLLRLCPLRQSTDPTTDSERIHLLRRTCLSSRRDREVVELSGQADDLARPVPKLTLTQTGPLQLRDEPLHGHAPPRRSGTSHFATWRSRSGNSVN